MKLLILKVPFAAAQLVRVGIPGFHGNCKGITPSNEAFRGVGGVC